MKRGKVGAGLGVAVSMLLACGGPTGRDGGAQVAPEPASYLFSGGPILTLNGGEGAEALAIGGGRIVALGSRRELEAWRGPETVAVDLAGRALAPAFVDHHVHLLNLGLALLHGERPSPTFVDLAGLDAPERIAAAVGARAAALPPSTWILGQGWSQGAWGAVALPDEAPLSAAAPANPVFLTRVDGHAGWANAAALRQAAIDRATPDPAGGAIARRADGEPTGVLLERANELLRPFIPEPSDDEIRRAFRLACEALAGQGVVEVFDAGVLGVPGVVDLTLDFGRYARLLAAEDGARPLPLRVHLMIPAPSAFAAEVVAAPETYRRLSPRVGVTHLKLFVDGALGSRGALLSHPYADDPSTHGVERMTAAEIATEAAAALDAGLDVATHAIGDRAVGRALDVYAALVAERPDLDPARLRIEHFSYAAEPDFARAAELGIVLVVNPDFVAPDDGGRAMEDARVGDENSARVYAFGRLAAQGARLAFASDYFTAPLAPMIGVYSAATRSNAEGLPAEGWHGGERLGREESLRIQSRLWPAGGGDPREGSLAVGGPADLVVWSGDPLAAEAGELLGLTPTATLLAGELTSGALP